MSLFINFSSIRHERREEKKGRIQVSIYYYIISGLYADVILNEDIQFMIKTGQAFNIEH